MEWTRIEGPAKAILCAQCGRTIRRGQVGVFQRLGSSYPGKRTVWWHAKCIAAVMEVCPPDNDQQAFTALRDKIATSGLAFPD